MCKNIAIPTSPSSVYLMFQAAHWAWTSVLLYYAAVAIVADPWMFVFNCSIAVEAYLYQSSPNWFAVKRTCNYDSQPIHKGSATSLLK